ncbi:unnamed protein product [Sphagnum balticum]
MHNCDSLDTRTTTVSTPVGMRTRMYSGCAGDAVISSGRFCLCDKPDECTFVPSLLDYDRSEPPHDQRIRDGRAGQRR